MLSNEQAIEVLHELDGSLYETQQVALDMAINALEQQTSEVLINLVSEQEKWLSVAGYNAYNVDIAFKSIVKAIQNVHISSTSEDCVSRAKVITIIQNHWWNCRDIDKLVNELPPVTPTQRWIPVSERLPEESGNYLLYGKVVDYEEKCVFIGEYDSDYEMFGYKEDIYDSETLGFLDSEFCEYNKVIAWQPLPQPYEEKRGNENEIN